MPKQQKVVQPGKRTKMPKDYPVDRYPYMAVKPGQLPSERQYFRSHTEAIKKLRDEVFKLGDQFKNIARIEDGQVLADRSIAANCDAIITALGLLSSSGGSLDMEVDPHTGTRYRVELVRRQAA